MKIAAVRLAVAAVLFVGWIGYLGYLAAVTRNPIVLSRPQFLVSQCDVIATYQGGATFSIDDVLYPKDATAPKKGETLAVHNLEKCQTYSPGDGWRVAPLAEHAQYLLPLQTAAGSAPAGVDPQHTMDVVPSPTASGLIPRIYPDTPDVRRQYQAIKPSELQP